MANKQRGERDIVLKDGNTYTLEWTLNAIAGAEELFDGRDLSQVKAEDLKAAQYRRLIWLGLQSHHDDLTEHQVGNLITTANVVDVVSALFEVVSVAQEALPGNDGKAQAKRKAKAPEEEPVGTGAK